MSLFARGRKYSSSKRITWEEAPDVLKRVSLLVEKLNLTHIKIERIFAYRSIYSKTRAYARIWGLSNLWQRTLNVPPTYIIEVLSEHFDKLSDREKDKVLLHELTHIPANFSGALVPHTHRKKNSFHDKLRRIIKGYDRI